MPTPRFRVLPWRYGEGIGHGLALPAARVSLRGRLSSLVENRKSKKSEKRKIGKSEKRKIGKTGNRSCGVSGLDLCASPMPMPMPKSSFEGVVIRRLDL